MEISLTIDGVEYEVKPKTASTTKSTRQKIYEMATSDECYMVQNDTKWKAMMKWFYGKEQTQPWCSIWVSYVVNKCGLLGKAYKKVDGCDVAKEWAVKEGKLILAPKYGGDGKYKPQKGDIVLFSSKAIYADCTHVGIVSNVDGDTLTYIGGNQVISGKSYVNYKTTKLSGTYIVGYIVTE